MSNRWAQSGWIAHLVSRSGLGSVEAAKRWCQAHQVRIWMDKLGYLRPHVKEIDAANLHAYAEAEERDRLRDAS